MKCLQCGKETGNPKFCSRSCSAIYNNKGIKRHGNNTTICPMCGGNKSLTSETCLNCFRIRTTVKQGKRKLEEVIRDNSKYKCEQVRRHAHAVMRDFSNKEKKCEVCGYDIYLELCHIKPIVDFDFEDLLEDINNLDNLMWLCPNHHKEQELGLLENIA